MTNEEVIEQLKGIRSDYEADCKNSSFLATYITSTIKEILYQKDIEALDLAIKTLEERLQGEWIGIKTSCDIGHKFYYCSKCNREIDLIDGESLKDYPFCHCGADMRKGEKRIHKQTTLDDFLKEQLKDPEFKKEWEKLHDEDMKGGAEE